MTDTVIVCQCDTQSRCIPSWLMGQLISTCFPYFRHCAVSEVKVETLFLLEIQQWSDNFPPFERTTSNSASMWHLWTGHVFLMTCASITVSVCGIWFWHKYTGLRLCKTAIVTEVSLNMCYWIHKCLLGVTDWTKTTCDWWDTTAHLENVFRMRGITNFDTRQMALLP